MKTAPDPLARLPYGKRRKLRSAIDRVRWWMCGQHGRRAAEITDEVVAEQVRESTDDQLLDIHHGLGIDGLAALRKWAKKFN